MSNKSKTRKTSIPVLGLLTWRPMAGYEIKTQIEASIGNFWSESFGQLYPQLASLEQSGLIETDPDVQSDGRGKKVYRITTEGRAHLSDWLDAPPKSRPPRNELLMKLFFAPEGDFSTIAEHIAASKAEAQATLRRYRDIETELINRAQSQPKVRFWLMTLRNGLQHMQTHLNWCDEVLTELDQMKENHDDAP